MNVITSNPWVIRSTSRFETDVRLFCFPFAGGSASVFRLWNKQMPASIDVCQIQYPGHGTRMGEEPITSLPTMVRTAADAILPLCDKPFVLFGHSMGALIAYELALYMQNVKGIQPIGLIVAGRNPPDAVSPIPPIHQLPEPEFRAGLLEYGGTPEEVLANEELMGLVSPMLRADFALCETYEYCPDLGIVSCPLTAIGGLEDEMVPVENIMDWRRFTTADFAYEMLPGGHFFLNSHSSELINSIYKQINIWKQRDI